MNRKNFAIKLDKYQAFFSRYGKAIFCMMVVLSCIVDIWFLKAGRYKALLFLIGVQMFSGFVIAIHVFEEKYTKYIFLAPMVLILCAMTLIPLLYTGWISLHNVTIRTFVKQWDFIGLQNYMNSIITDPLTAEALIKSLEYVTIAVFFELVIGIAMAVAINATGKGQGIFTVLFFSGMMISDVVAGLIWKYMLSLDRGLINQLLALVGIPKQPWLTSHPLPLIKDLPVIGQWLVAHANANYGFLSIIFVEVWIRAPFIFIVILAGLKSLPGEPFEAAAIDGANRWQVFRYITLPLLKPIILIVAILRVVGAMKAAAHIWALFGPSVTTRTLTVSIYTTTVMKQNYGESAALSVLLVMVSIFLALLYMKIVSFGRR
jgi:multiple sugar transport system permease protein